MKIRLFKYSFTQKVNSVLMILALAWLTVSIPFVYDAQQKAASVESKTASTPADEEDSNPFSNTTEEKAPSSSVNTLSEEYLHHTEDLFHAAQISLSHQHPHAVSEYVAFHGELLCPPPNQLS